MKMFVLVAALIVSAVYFTEAKAGHSAVGCSGAAVAASCSAPEAAASCSGSASVAKMRRTPVRSFFSKLRANRRASCSGS